MAQIKISQISKDFNMKAKDVSDAFKEIGFEKKNSGAAVEAEEFELLLVHLTKSHQIKNMEAYTSGKVSIKASAENAEAKAAKEEPKEAAKPAPKAEAKAEP